MSAYQEYRTVFRDEAALVAALCSVGFKPDQIEQHKQAVPLHGYHGDERAQRAHVVIRRQHVGSASNDIGFERQADGTFLAHISGFDQRTRGYDSSWLGRVKQGYATHKVLQKARRNGYLVQQKKLGTGAVQLVLTRGR